MPTIYLNNQIQQRAAKATHLRRCFDIYNHDYSICSGLSIYSIVSTTNASHFTGCMHWDQFWFECMHDYMYMRILRKDNKQEDGKQHGG